MTPETQAKVRATFSDIWEWLKLHQWLFGFLSGIVVASVIALIL